jgi:hypothetical protein
MFDKILALQNQCIKNSTTNGQRQTVKIKFFRFFEKDGHKEEKCFALEKLKGN